MHNIPAISKRLLPNSTHRDLGSRVPNALLRVAIAVLVCRTVNRTPIYPFDTAESTHTLKIPLPPLYMSTPGGTWFGPLCDRYFITGGTLNNTHPKEVRLNTASDSNIIPPPGGYHTIHPLNTNTMYLSHYDLRPNHRRL